MLLSTLMANYSPNASYTGALMANDMVLAVDTSAEQNADYANYAVVEEYIEGIESSINAETTEKEYIRSRKSTSKSSNQRTFSISGDRYVGDTAQDFFMSKKYATGQDAVCKYVYFDLKTGVGESGTLTISVDTDGGGNAGDNSTISINLSKTGAAPAAYTYGATGTTYSVVLDPNGGVIEAGHNVTSYTVGTGATLPTSSYVTKEGYTFDGWYDSATLTETASIGTSDTGNKTFYAKWTT